MQMTLELLEAQRNGAIVPLSEAPCSAWMDPRKPFWWRRNQLQKEADRIAQNQIVYRSREYGPSILRAKEARDEFYRKHELELWPNTVHEPQARQKTPDESPQ